MIVTLPVCAQEQENELAPDRVDAQPSRPLRILLADDEPGVRLVTEQFLTQDGHNVVSVPDGADVISYLEKGEVVDLVVLDLLMPGMGGRECG